MNLLSLGIHCNRVEDVSSSQLTMHQGVMDLPLGMQLFCLSCRCDHDRGFDKLRGTFVNYPRLVAVKNLRDPK